MDKKTAQIIVKMLGDQESQEAWQAFLLAKLGKVQHALEINQGETFLNLQGQAWQIRDFMKLREAAVAVLMKEK